MGRKSTAKLEILNEEELLENLINDYTATKQKMIIQLKHGKVDKDAFMDDVNHHIDTHYRTSGDEKERVLLLFEQYIFGYFRMMPLIEDPDISDIRCLAFDNIRVKKRGKRYEAEVKFHSAGEYRSFIDMIATKNQVSVSNTNAIQRFTDTTSSPDFILRFTVCMPLVNTYDVPYLAIRKIPKKFLEMDDLVEAEMMSKEVSEMLIKRFREGSTIICGGNSSGKTTLLNALKETLPQNKSVLVTQQADELTTRKHPDMMFLHSLPGTGESQVSYDLKDISIAGLTMDVDYFLVGEIKGAEAIYVLNAAYTGQICAATIHAPAAVRAMDKLVDYSMYGSRYSRDELMKMLDCFSTVIHMKDFKVHEVYAVGEWMPDKKEITYECLYAGGEEKC